MASSMSISFEAGSDYEAKADKEQGQDAQPIAVIEDERSDEGVTDHQGPSSTKRGFNRGEIEFICHKLPLVARRHCLAQEHHGAAQQSRPPWNKWG